MGPVVGTTVDGAVLLLTGAGVLTVDVPTVLLGEGVDGCPPDALMHPAAPTATVASAAIHHLVIS